MLFSKSFFLSFAASLSLLDAVYAGPHQLRPLHQHAGRTLQSTGVNVTTRGLSKRFSNARFSYYAAGTGACGQTNTASDFIVALNSDQYGSGGYCFETITITYNGKSTQAEIVDECPGCPYGGLDFSEGLFDYFSSEDAGIIYGEWEFGSGATTTTSAKAEPTTTSTTYTPTSTYTPPTSTVKKTTATPTSTSTTSTWSSTTKTSTTTHTSTTPSSTSTSASSSSVWSSSVYSSSDLASSTVSSASPAESSASVTDSLDTSSVLEQFNLAIIGLGGIVAFGAVSE